MIGCDFISLDSPFINPVGYSFCFYYCVFCADGCFSCPFDFLPHHLVCVDEFALYPQVKYVQLSLF